MILRRKLQIHGACELITNGDGTCLFLVSKGRCQFSAYKEMLLGVVCCHSLRRSRQNTFCELALNKGTSRRRHHQKYFKCPLSYQDVPRHFKTKKSVSLLKIKTSIDSIKTLCPLSPTHLGLTQVQLWCW